MAVLDSFHIFINDFSVDRRLLANFLIGQSALRLNTFELYANRSAVSNHGTQRLDEDHYRLILGFAGTSALIVTKAVCTI
jgi:hypothetical protein